MLFIATGRTYAGDAQARETDRAPREIDAKCWFNAQPVRLYDPPELILLEFWSVRSRESREFVDTISALHEAYDDGRLLIVALTNDECKDAKAFIHREEIPYKVGAESRSPKDYGIDELPGVVLIDSGKRRIVARWSGRQVKGKAIAKAIRDFLGPPTGGGGDSGSLPPEQRAVLLETISGVNDGLAGLTEQILATDGEIGPEDLWPLERFYDDNMLEDPTRNDALARAANYARSAILGDRTVGYGKLFASGRLSDAARLAIRDRVLEIARKDPSDKVRGGAIHALRRIIGQPGDPVLLEALRSMREAVGSVRERVGNPLIRASLDQTLKELDPATRAATLAEKETRPVGLRLSRMLKASPDPASSPWAEAHAYIQTVPQRTTEQLLEDYWSFPDPPDDEIGRQNATLKRMEARRQVGHRLARGEVRDLRALKDHLARALSQEPDVWILRGIVDSLKDIAEHGGRGLRAEIMELFEQRLSAESDRYVHARLEMYLQELKTR